MRGAERSAGNTAKKYRAHRARGADGGAVRGELARRCFGGVARLGQSAAPGA